MFEQSLYEPQQPAQPERVITPPSEGDFLYGYEIKSWDIGPRIYKILGVAAAVNLLALLVVAQTSMLTMKGCDSPLVGGVCQVLDTVYVGAMLFGTERDMVDAEYDKTELGEDYDVTFVDMTGATPPISYPEGYFQIANRDELAALAALASDPGMITSGIPGIPDGLSMAPPSVNGGSMLDTKPNLPPVNSNPIEGELPSGFGNNDQNAGGSLARPRLRPKIKRPVTPPPATNPDGSIPGIPNSGQTAEVKPSPSPLPTIVPPAGDNREGAINVRPLADLGDRINSLIDKNEYRLDTPFSLVAKAKLSKEGKLENFGVVRSEAATETPVKVAVDAILALNDSNHLRMLSDLSGKNLNIAMAMDATSLKATIDSEVDSEMRANSIRSGLMLALDLAKRGKSDSTDQNDKDDLLLLESAKVEVVGKKIVIRFEGPKEVFLPMFERKLAQQRNAPKQQNGTSSARSQNNTASPE